MHKYAKISLFVHNDAYFSLIKLKYAYLSTNVLICACLS